MSGPTVEVRPVATPVAAQVVVVVAGSLVAGLAVGLGHGDRDRLLELGGAAVLAVLVVIGGRSLRARRGPTATASVVLGALAAASVSFLVGNAVAPAVSPARDLLYTPAGTRVEVYFHGEPGGAELTGPGDPAPMRSGRGYAFDCAVTIDLTGMPQTWLRSGSGSGWVPATAVRTAAGTYPDDVRPCGDATVPKAAPGGSRSVQPGVTRPS